MTSQEASSSANKSKDGVPIWDGAAESFQAYYEAALLYEQTTPYHKRYLTGPKLQSELTGAAQRLIVGQPPEWLSFPGGVQTLLQHLRQCLGKPQMPELTDLLSKYFKNSKRRSGEAMGEYITRKCELYVRAQQAMNRVRPHHDGHQRTSATPQEYGRWRSWATSGRRQSVESGTSEVPTEASENVDTHAAAPTAPTEPAERGSDDQPRDWWRREGSWGWPSWSWDDDQWSSSDYWGYSSSSWGQGYAATTARTPLPELVPEFVQAWMLLQDANIEANERNTILIAARGDMSLQRVAQEMRNHFSDQDIRRREGTRRHQGFLGEHLDEESDDDAAGNPQGTEASFVAEEELNEEGQALWSEAETEVQEALAVMGQARRTLRGARERQKEVRQNRQYYRGGGGKGFRYNSGSSTSANSTTNRDGHMTCLKCGKKGHRAAVCPNGASSSSSRPKESAPFVCYVEATALHAQEPEDYKQTTAEAMQDGKGIIDCGATKSLGSVQALERVIQLSRNGVHKVDTADTPTFGFGNTTEDRCLSTVHLNLDAGGRPGVLKVHALDRGATPILLSIDTLKSLKALLDFSDGTMVRGIDATRIVQLEESSTGHLLLPLTGDIMARSQPAAQAVPSLSSYLRSHEPKPAFNASEVGQDTNASVSPPEFCDE